MADGADDASDSITKQYKGPVLLAAVAVHATLLIALSSRHRRSNHPAIRLALSGVSAVYFPLISNVLSYMPTYLSSVLKSLKNDPLHRYYHYDLALKVFLIVHVLSSLVLVQFLKAKADMAALAVAAVSSPVAGDDINCLKIRPSIDSLIYSFWVAGVVTYRLIPYVYADRHSNVPVVIQIQLPPAYNTMLLIAPLWILGACRMVLRFAAFKMATRSLALGRNAHFIEGYMWQLRKWGCFVVAAADGQAAAAVPRLIVTGESTKDVEETPLGLGYHRHAHENTEASSLVTLDRVWSCQELAPFPELKDLCLSLALFKCLRRRFAGRRLAEADTSWAFHFVCHGLLGSVQDHERIFRVIADELSFARGFYYSPLPVSSLGTPYAALHFFLSLLITPLLFLVALQLVHASVLIFSVIDGSAWYVTATTAVLAFVLAAVNAGTEVSDMVDTVRSNWTKISIISLYIRWSSSSNKSSWLPPKLIFSGLRKCKCSQQWKDEIGQMDLLQRPPAWPHLILRIIPRKKKKKVPLPPQVKAAILASLRSSGGQLSNGMATLRRRCQAFSHGITWACHGHGAGEVTSTTTSDLLLVWHIATSLFEIRIQSSSSSSSSTPAASANVNMVVAQSLSRYCAYLVVEAPDLLPDDSAWTKRLYKDVKKCTEEVLKNKKSRDVPVPAQAESPSSVYDLLTTSDSPQSNELLEKGSKLGKQLVSEAASAGEDAVWELLAEFWSEVMLYIAPSDNPKRHIRALQRGGELITLLWALLLHAGITSRPPPEFNGTACVLVSKGDPDFQSNA